MSTLSDRPHPSTAPAGTDPAAPDPASPEPGRPRQTVGRPRGAQHDQAAWLAQLEAEDLRRLVSSLPVIEQAKGVLMGYYAIGPDEAFALLRRWSSTRNLKVRLLCEGIVAATGRPHPERHGSLVAHLRELGLVD